MFELTKEENDVLRSQFATLRHGRHSKYLPFAFSEHGILKVDNQDKNIEVIFRYCTTGTEGTTKKRNWLQNLEREII